VGADLRLEKVRSRLQSEAGLVHLFYGDSITHCTTSSGNFRSYPQHFESVLRCSRRLDAVANTAISGNTTRQLVDEFEARAARLRPDIVYIMIGMNDCCVNRQLSLAEFNTNLDILIGKFQELGSLVVLQTTCPVIPSAKQSATREETISAYMQAMRDRAESHDLPLVDHYSHWLERPAFPYAWMNDAFHPNEKGHLAFARHLLRCCGLENLDHIAFQSPL
jgi:lysophospholipase L1-like esterase